MPKRGGLKSAGKRCRKAPLSCNAAFSVLHCSFSLAAAQLLVKKPLPRCRKANVAVQLLQRSIPKTAAQLPFSIVTCLAKVFGRTDFSRNFIFGPPDFFRGFSRRIFSPHFCGKKWPEKSSRKIPGKILQNLHNKNPRHISAKGLGLRDMLQGWGLEGWGLGLPKN